MLVQAEQKTVFRVATPAGTTEASEATDLVPQGSGGAARASGLDIALGLEQQLLAARKKFSLEELGATLNLFKMTLPGLARTLTALILVISRFPRCLN